MSNLGPSDDKFGTFWGVQGPPGPLLGCAYGENYTTNKGKIGGVPKLHPLEGNRVKQYLIRTEL